MRSYRIARSIFIMIFFSLIVMMSCSTGDADGRDQKMDQRQAFATGTPTWTQLFPQNVPGSRKWAAMAYDAKREKLVMFGGINKSTTPSTVYGDTWEFDGNEWNEVHPNVSPEQRSGAKMCYCRDWDKIVLFGGTTNDTWSYRDGKWEQLHPQKSPSARSRSGMAYDEHLKKLVIYGGIRANTYFNETWSFDGITWEMNEEASGNFLISPAMVYDTKGQRILRFGGYTSLTNPYNDFWAYDGTRWTRIQTETMIPPRVQFASTYDRFRQVMILFSGGTVFSLISDTWEYDGTDWRLVETDGAPDPPRWSPDMCYMDAQNGSILFGGYGGPYVNETWRYNAVTTAPTTSHGALIVIGFCLSCLLLFSLRKSGPGQSRLF